MWNFMRIIPALLLASVLAATPVLGAPVPAPKLPKVPHAFVIVMENEENTALMGNPQAPYINSWITKYGYAANYYGVTHPSLPNYLALTAGSYFKTFDDSDGHRYSGTNIVDQMESHHLSWKAYMEGMPRVGFTGDSYPTSKIDLYERKHNPFMMYRDVLNSAARRANVVPGVRIFHDLKVGHVPTLSFISPNLCHDMHGIKAPHSPCPPNQKALIKTGDAALHVLVGSIFHSPAWVGDSTIFIVWDEGTTVTGCCGSPKGDGGGKVVTIVIARTGVRHFVSHTAYNHYSLLKTLEDVWGLGCMRETCRSDVRPMPEFLRPGAG
jgi:phosphatidylinositol-3-phosphatase